MLRISLRNTLAHKFRFALTTLAVVLGVGFVVGSFAVTDSLRNSINRLFADITGGTDVSVRAHTDLGGSSVGPSSRGRVPASLVPIVQSVDGVRAAEGTVAGYAQLLDKHDKALKSTGAPFIGVSYGKDSALARGTLNEGRAPKGRYEVAIDRGSASAYGYKVGDSATVLLADGSRPRVRIVGIFTFGKANSLLGARLTAFDSAVAPQLLGVPGMFDQIDVAAVRGVNPTVLMRRIQAHLPAGVEAVTGVDATNENKAAVNGMMGTFQNVMLGFAAVSLFVSAFFINNTLSIVVGQRTRELALLRSIAATPGQITRSVMAEGMFVGAVASVLGVAFGVLISKGLQAILSAAGFGIPQGPTVLLPRTLAAAFVVGIGVTVLASLAPARRASAVAPVEGMREGFAPVLWSSTRRLGVGLAGVASGAVLVFLGLEVAHKAMARASLLGVGAIAVFMGIAQLSPVVAIPVAGALGRPVARLFRVSGRLAHANAVRNRERTAKSAAALMIGLALVTSVFIIGTSMKRTFASAMDSSVSADFVFTNIGSGATGFSPAVTQRVADVPGVAAVTGVRAGQIKFEGKTRDVIAVDPLAAAQVVDIGLTSGSFAELDGNSILIHQDPARDFHLRVGDMANVTLATGGTRRLRVAGIYSDSAMVGNYIVSRSLFDRYYPTLTLDLMAFARLDNGADAQAAAQAIGTILKDFPQVQVQDQTAFAEQQTKQFNSMLVAVNGLLGLALFIALLGIANTLALSVLERTREIGLLRAVGMVRRQAREMILAESAMVAVFGAVLGVAVGCVFGVVAAASLPSSIVTTIAVPYKTIVVIIGVAALCGVVAGLLPARRAARLDVLQAIASQ